jgi:hypothetical protein
MIFLEHSLKVLANTTHRYFKPTIPLDRTFQSAKLDPGTEQRVRH